MIILEMNNKKDKLQDFFKSLDLLNGKWDLLNKEKVLIKQGIIDKSLTNLYQEQYKISNEFRQLKENNKDIIY